MIDERVAGPTTGPALLCWRRWKRRCENHESRIACGNNDWGRTCRWFEKVDFDDDDDVVIKENNAFWLVNGGGCG
jgi:hypothetical protein